MFIVNSHLSFLVRLVQTRRKLLARASASQIFPDLLVIVILSRVSLVQPVMGVCLYQGDPHRNDAREAVFS